VFGGKNRQDLNLTVHFCWAIVAAGGWLKQFSPQIQLLEMLLKSVYNNPNLEHLSDDLLVQLYQLNLSVALEGKRSNVYDGKAVELPPLAKGDHCSTLAEEAMKKWVLEEQGGKGEVVEEIGNYLKSLGVEVVNDNFSFSLLVLGGEGGRGGADQAGFLSVDFECVGAEEGDKVAIRILNGGAYVKGELETARSLDGSNKLARRLLEGGGYRVLEISIDDWKKESENFNEHMFMKNLLNGVGVRMSL